MNILEKIIEKKKKEVEQRKKINNRYELEKSPLYKNEPLSFKDFLLNKNKTGIIAEYKRRSPSKGIINDHSPVKEITAVYAKHGASAVSILTDEEFFGGSLNDLVSSAMVGVPLLRKDFIIDDYQLAESKAHGADIILLIAACLSKDDVKYLSSFAKNIGLNVLLEVHNEQELDHLCDKVDVVGVNNRDLKSFIVDINRSISLGKQIPKGMIKISESGIDSVESIMLLKEHGFNGFLIGEKFMREKDPAVAFKEFVDELNKKNETESLRHNAS